MIDRSSRNTAYIQIRRLATGRAGGFECEDALMALPGDDMGIAAIRRTIREMIDEHDRPLKSIFAKGTEMRTRLSRWLLFLKSDSDYMWPVLELPAGILDYYRPTFFDKITGADKRTRESITQFMRSGDYNYWPFTSRDDFERATNGISRIGLRLAASISEN